MPLLESQPESEDVGWRRPGNNPMISNKGLGIEENLPGKGAKSVVFSCMASSSAVAAGSCKGFAITNQERIMEGLRRFRVKTLDRTKPLQISPKSLKDENLRTGPLSEPQKGDQHEERGRWADLSQPNLVVAPQAQQRGSSYTVPRRRPQHRTMPQWRTPHFGCFDSLVKSPANSDIIHHS